MPKNKEFSKEEVTLTLQVFKQFLEDQVTIVVAEDFYGWCEEQMKGGKDER